MCFFKDKRMDNSRTNKNPVYLLWGDGIFILLGSKIRTSFQDIDLLQQVSGTFLLRPDDPRDK